MSEGRRSGPFGLLAHNSAFLSLWIGESASVIGDQVTRLALPLTAVLLLHAGAASMGYLMAVGLLPFVFLSLPVGMWLDRRGKRRSLVIVSDVGRACLLLTVPTAFLLGWLNLGQLYVVAALIGAFQVIFDLAYPSVVTVIERFSNP